MMIFFRNLKRILSAALVAFSVVFGANATVVIPNGYQQVDASYCDNNGLSILPEGDNCICVASGSGPADYTNIHWVCEDLSGGGSSIIISLNRNGGTGTIKNNSGTSFPDGLNATMSCTSGATNVELPTWSETVTANNTTNIANGNKIFLGWSSSSTATSGTYSITCPNTATTYYAVWGNPAYIPSGNGWQFHGWASNPNTTTTQYTDGQTANDVCITGDDVTLYGVWDRDILFRYYNSATAIVPVDTTATQYYYNTSSIETGSTNVSSVAVPTLYNQADYGWEARGWKTNTLADPSVVYSTESAQISPRITDTNTYYALYRRPVTLKYWSNGGTGTMSDMTTNQYFVAGSQTSSSAYFILPNNGFTKTGYTFNGWAAGSPSGQPFSAGTSVEFPNKQWMSTNVYNMYARWTANTFNVAYAGGGNTGGSAPSSPTSCTYDGTCNAPANTYTKTGYTFNGWTCTASSGSCAKSTYTAGESIANATSVNGATITLTAQWISTGCGVGNYYDEDDEQCHSCSTETNGEYTQSATNATSINQCYRACTTANINNSSAVTGNVYYDGVNTCSATTCVTGYNRKTLSEIIGSNNGEYSAFIKSNGDFSELNSNYGLAHYGWTENDRNKWAVQYGNEKGMLIGGAYCSEVEGDEGATYTISELGGDGGNCYCNITDYKRAQSNNQSISPWWLRSNLSVSSSCSSSCAAYCRLSMDQAGFTPIFRSNVLSAGNAYFCEPATSTITFVLNGGSGTAPNNVTATYGQSMPALSTTEKPTKSGYAFGGWWDSATVGTGTQYYNREGSSVHTWNKTGSQTLYARWVPVYTITLDGNGGSSNQDMYAVSEDYEDDGVTWGVYCNEDATLSAWSQNIVSRCGISLPTRTGYTFNGYYSDPIDDDVDNEMIGGAGSVNNLDDTAGASTGDFTIYAQWTPISYTVTFDENTEDDVTYMPSENPRTCTYGDIDGCYVVGRAYGHGGGNNILPRREGYNFVEWNTEPDGTGDGFEYERYEVEYIGGGYRADLSDLFDSGEDEITLYAIWEPREIEITFDENTTDTVTYMPLDNPRTCTYGDIDGCYVGARAYGHGGGNNILPRREGYNFVEWNTEPDGTGDGFEYERYEGEYTGSGYRVDLSDLFDSGEDEITLYARWTPNTYNIIYKDGNATMSGMSPATYTVGTGATVNATPTKANATFNGWCTSAGLTGCSATQSISTTDYGDKTYYANFTCDTGYTSKDIVVLDRFYDAACGSSRFEGTSVTPHFACSFEQLRNNTCPYSCSTPATSGNWMIKDADDNVVKGEMACLDHAPTASGIDPDLVVQAGTNEGRYCWCKVTNYTDSDGNETQVSSNWFIVDDSVEEDYRPNSNGGYTDQNDCRRKCGSGCVYMVALKTTSAYQSFTDAVENICEPAATYTVTLDKNANDATDGTTSVTATYGSPMPLPITLPTRTGYIFDGYWDAQTGGTQYYGVVREVGGGANQALWGLYATSAHNWDKTSNTTLYAHWVPGATSFDLKNYNGNTLGTLYTKYDVGVSANSDYTNLMTTSANPITPPTRSGYTFDGYYQGIVGRSGMQIDGGDTGNEYEFSTPLTQYINANGYITSEGLSDAQSQAAGYASAYTSGMALVGNNAFDIWLAKWTPIDYTIAYNNVDGATFSGAPHTVYNIESSDITLLSPSKTGYTFDGWYTNSGLTGTPVTQITTGSTGNKTFWAKWTLNCSGDYEDDGSGSCQCPAEYPNDDGDGHCCPTGEYYDDLEGACVADEPSCTEGYDDVCGVCYEDETCEPGYSWEGCECVEDEEPACDDGEYYDNDVCNACPNGYTSDGETATSENDCYKPCTTANILHSTAVTGLDYYGDGLDTCAATACETGYVVKSLTDTIGTTAVPDNSSTGSYWGAIGNGNYGSVWGSANRYGLSGRNIFLSDYAEKGILTGRGVCSTQSGSGFWNSDITSPEDLTVSYNVSSDFGTGANCWCKIDGYKPGLNSESQNFENAPWVFFYTFSIASDNTTASDCAADCSAWCAMYTNRDNANALIYRSAVFNSIGAPSSAMCVPIVFSVSYDISGAQGSAPSSPSVCAYGGTCNAPENTYKTGYGSTGTITKIGHTFAGWSCSASTGSCAQATYAIGDSIATATTVNGATITLTAQWTPNTYNIYYNNMSDDELYTGAPESYTYGIGATIDWTPTYEGHTFDGWCTDEELTDCDSSQTIGTTATGDKQFWASWVLDCQENEHEEDGECVPDDPEPMCDGDYVDDGAGGCQCPAEYPNDDGDGHCCPDGEYYDDLEGTCIADTPTCAGDYEDDGDGNCVCPVDYPNDDGDGHCCPDGEYYDAAEGTCVTDEPYPTCEGDYVDDGSGSCVCPMGYPNDDGNGHCCSAGEYYDAAEGACIADTPTCAGDYEDDGDGNCQCPAEYPNDYGLGHCCPDGEYYDNAEETCVTYEPDPICEGDYEDDGEGNCQCPAEYPNDYGLGHCCPAGEYYDDLEGTCIADTPTCAGDYEDDGDGNCVCPVDYPNDDGDGHCCPDGEYYDINEATCVPDEPVCSDGYDESCGVCYEDETCGEGYYWEDCGCKRICPNGYTYTNGTCVDPTTGCLAFSSNVQNFYATLGVHMVGNDISTADYIETPAIRFDLNGNGSINTNECIVARISSNDFETVDNSDATDQDIKDALTNVMFCKYNPSTQNYDLGCTMKPTVCSVSELNSLISTPTTTNALGIVGGWLNMTQQDLANLNSMMSYTPATAPLYQRCSGESCPAGTTDYNGVCCPSGTEWDSDTGTCASVTPPTPSTCPTITTNYTMNGIPMYVIQANNMTIELVPAYQTTYNDICLMFGMTQDELGNSWMFYVQNYAELVDVMANDTAPTNAIKFSPMLEICNSETSSLLSMTPAQVLTWYQNKLQTEGSPSLANFVSYMDSNGFFTVMDSNGLNGSSVLSWLVSQSQRCPVTCSAGQYLYSDDGGMPFAKCHDCDGDHCCLENERTFTFDEYRNMGMFNDFCPESCPGDQYYDANEDACLCPPVRDTFGAMMVNQYDGEYDGSPRCFVDFIFGKSPEMADIDPGDVDSSYNASSTYNAHAIYNEITCVYNPTTHAYDRCKSNTAVCERGYYVPQLPTSIDLDEDPRTEYKPIAQVANLCTIGAANHYTTMFDYGTGLRLSEMGNKEKNQELQDERSDLESTLSAINEDDSGWSRMAASLAGGASRLGEAPLSKSAANATPYEYTNIITGNQQLLSWQYDSCPVTHPYSDAGSYTKTQCYNNCSTANVPHSSAVTGRDYYGNGSDTCAATSCASGYHIQQVSANVPDLNSIIGINEAESAALIYGDGTASESNNIGGSNKGQSYYGISDNNTFAADFGNNGIITGRAACSTTSGSGIWSQNGVRRDYDDYSGAVSTETEITPEFGTGANCWCKIDGYKPNNGNIQNLDSLWVYEDQYRDAEQCEDYCLENCASALTNTNIVENNDWETLTLRSNVLGGVRRYSYCVENTGPACTGDYEDDGNGNCVCPSATPVDDGNGHCCPTGQTYDSNAGECVSASVTCPTHSTTLPYGPGAELPGQGYDFDGDGEITIDECFVARQYGNIGSVLTESDLQNNDMLAYLYELYLDQGTWDEDAPLNTSAVASMAFCRYNESTGNYDGDCTPAVPLCSRDEILAMTNSVDGTTISVFNYVVDLVEDFFDTTIPAAYYYQMFTETSDDISVLENPQTGATRCEFNPGFDGTCPQYSSDFKATLNGPAWEQQLFGTSYDFNGDGQITIDECITTKVYGSAWFDFVVAAYVLTNGNLTQLEQALSSASSTDQAQFMSIMIGSQYSDEQKKAFFLSLVAKYSSGIFSMFSQQSYSAFSEEFAQMTSQYFNSGGVLGNIYPLADNEVDPELWGGLAQYDLNFAHVAGFSICRYNEETGNYDTNCTPIMQACNISDLQQLDSLAGSNSIVSTILQQDSHAFSLDTDEVYLLNQCSCSASNNTLPDDFCEALDCPTGYTNTPAGDFNGFQLDRTRKNGVGIRWGCEPIQYKVYLDGNGADSGNMGYVLNEDDDEYLLYGNEYELPANTFTKTGYTFTEWNTEWDGSGDSYEDQAEIENLTIVDYEYSNEPVPLYAQWEPTTYTITYNGVEGATNNNPANYTIESAAITITEPVKPGYTFVGWCDQTNPNCTPSGTTYTIASGSTGNVTLYAKWIADVYTITYSGLQGATNNNPATYTIEDTPITLSNPTRNNYTFDGWTITTAPTHWGTGSSSSGSANFVIGSGTYGNIELTANWTLSECPSGQVLVDGTCMNGKFIVKTTQDTDSFQFSISAAGNFTVNCGDGGTLTSSANDVTNNSSIDRTNDTDNAVYTCSWSSSGEHMVTFDGTVTEYNNSGSRSAIDFSRGGSYKIAAVYGSLGAIFRTLNDGSDDPSKQPKFIDTFYEQPNLTSLPAELFDGVTGAAYEMFARTFFNCSRLTSLPAGLFNGIDGAADRMFFRTFDGCSGLTSLPTDLFNGIDGAASGMFQETFDGCRSLTSLPTDLFNGIDGAAVAMFYGTFKDCAGLTSLPTDLFNGIDGAAESMFEETFKNCTGLTSLPTDLFNGIDGAANKMFDGTFMGCTGLTSLPTNSNGNSTLFNGIDGAAYEMFANTFMGCTGLTSLPTDLFNGIDGAARYMFGQTFKNCTGLTSLPIDSNGNSTLFNGIDGAAEGMFVGTFYGCTGLTSLPHYLFDGIDGAAEKLFEETFQGCTGLTSLPIDSNGNSTLFNGIDGAAGNMFAGTFKNCSSLTSLPTDLFNGIDGAAADMFYGTFKDCTGLTSLPTDLFNGIDGAASGMFRETFQGCTSLTSLPIDSNGNSTLFNGIDGAEYEMFYSTFDGCSGLTSLPTDLFNGIDGAAEGMFVRTFYDCTSLTSVPSGLFDGVSGTAERMFASTFNGCTGLTTIPVDLFDGVSGTLPTGMLYRTFNNATSLDTVDLGNGETTSYVPGFFLNNITGKTSGGRNHATDMFTGTDLDDPCPSGTADVTRDIFSEAGKPWCAIATYNITYMDGGVELTGLTPTTYTSGVGATINAQPTKVGATFMNWCTDIGLTSCAYPQTISANVSGDKTFWANFGCAGGYENIGTIIGNNGYVEGAADEGEFMLVYEDNSSLTGIAACSDREGANPWPDETFNLEGVELGPDWPYTTFSENIVSGDISISDGTNCYCKLDEYRPDGWWDSNSAITLDTHWFYIGQFDCDKCAQGCADVINSDISLRNTMINLSSSKCMPLTYTITYNLGGGEFGNNTTHPNTYTVNDNFKIDDPTRAHYTFDGWTIDSEQTNWGDGSSEDGDKDFVIGSGTYGNIELTANWTPDTYTTSYRCDTNTAPAVERTATYGENYTHADNFCSKTGYHFGGWIVSNTDPVQIDDPTVVFQWLYTEDKTFTASWTPNTYNITYMDAGVAMSGLTPATYTYGTGATVNATPTKQNASFEGWCTDAGLTSCASSYTISASDTGDKTYYAKFTCNTGYEPSPVYAMDLLNGYAGHTRLNVSGDGGASRLSYNQNVYEQYVLNRDIKKGTWMVTDANQLSIVGVSTCINHSAPVDSIYDPDLNTQQGLETGSDCWCRVTNIVKPNLEEYPLTSVWYYKYTSQDCGHWCTSACSDEFINELGPQQHINTIPAYQSVTSSAVGSICEPAIYTITYNLNGGTNFANAPTSYTVESETIVLGTPTRAGYIFNGWYTNSNLTGTATTQIPHGSTGNKEFWAKWTQCVCTESTGVVSNSCSASVANNQCVYAFTCAAGYAKANQTVTTSSTSYTASCDACIAGTYASTTGMTSCPICPDDSYSEQAASTACTPCLENYKTKRQDPDVASNHDSHRDCKITCRGGWYINVANDTVCTAAGENNWVPGSVVIQGDISPRPTPCSDGEMTIGYGAGADEAADCGRKLHVGDDIVWLKKIKQATPSLAVRYRNGNLNRVYYGRMSRVAYPTSAGDGQYFATNYNSKKYFIFDDAAEEKIYDIIWKLVTNVSLDGTKNGFLSNDGTSKSAQSTYKLTINGTWGTTFPHAIIKGESSCSTQTGTVNKSDINVSTSRETTGDHCWCRLTNVDNDKVILSWTYPDQNDLNTPCSKYCARLCARQANSNEAFRNALYSGAEEVEERTCEPCQASGGAECSLDETGGVCTYTTSCMTGYHGLTGEGTAEPSCTANTYTVVYNANGGSGTMANSTFTYGTQAALRNNSYTKSGQTFVGWGTSAGATTVAYHNGDTVLNLTSTDNATIILYAIWGSQGNALMSYVDEAGTKSGHISIDGTSSSSASSMNLTQNGTWGARFSYGDILGRANCNNTSGSAYTANPSLVTGTSGSQCWCQMQSYNGSPMSSKWVFVKTMKNDGDCGKSCAKQCGTDFISASKSNFRSAVYGSL